MNIITITGITSPSVSPNAAALANRETAVEAAKAVTRVTNDTEARSAASARSQLSALLKETEESRKSVKEPVLNLGRLIDDTAKSFAEPLMREELRLKTATNLFAAEVEARWQAEIKRQAEEARKAEIERQRVAAEAERARLAELAKVEAERQRVLAEARAKEQSELDAATSVRQEREARERAAAAALRAEAEAQSRKAAAFAAEQQITDSVPVRTYVAPPKPPGVKVPRFEITDAAALYKVRPEFFELVPRAIAINAAVRAGLKELPGFRGWMELEVRAI